MSPTRTLTRLRTILIDEFPNVLTVRRGLFTANTFGTLGLTPIASIKITVVAFTPAHVLLLSLGHAPSFTKFT